MPQRWWRWLGEQFAFVAVLAGLAVGFLLLLVQPDRWRLGLAVLGLAAVLAGMLRLFLPTLRAGFLAARGRSADTVLYLLLGGVILAVDIRLRS